MLSHTVRKPVTSELEILKGQDVDFAIPMLGDVNNIFLSNCHFKIVKACAVSKFDFVK